MAQLTHEQYERLERAVFDGSRIVIFRRGTEYIVVPQRLKIDQGRELIVAMHPTTGESMQFVVEEIDSIEVVDRR